LTIIDGYGSVLFYRRSSIGGMTEMAETMTTPSPVAESDVYPCCDPKTCTGCGCCADDKADGRPCC
jgi:hypothetical protein